MSDGNDYQAQIHKAFNNLLQAEVRLAEADGVLKKTTGPLQMEVRNAENAIKAHWIEIRNLMEDAGIVEENIPGDVVEGGALSDFRISYSTPPRKVVIADENALPEEFTKTERTPKRKEIAEFLRSREEAKLSMPNWACLERAEPKLQWRSIKKGK